jgi:hypothetical protein
VAVAVRTGVGVVPGASVAVTVGAGAGDVPGATVAGAVLLGGMLSDWLPEQPASSAAPATADKKDGLNRKFT